MNAGEGSVRSARFKDLGVTPATHRTQPDHQPRCAGEVLGPFTLWKFTLSTSVVDYTLVHMDELYVVRQESAWREDPDDGYDTATDEKTVYALFGLAIYGANCLEHELANTLAVAQVVKAQEEATRLIRDPWAKGFKDMMGRLVKRAQPHTSNFPDLVADLTKCLDRRNYLVHHFWRERVPDMLTVAGRTELCAALKADHRLFEQSAERLHEKVLDPMMSKLGITAELLDAQYEAERRDALARH